MEPTKAPTLLDVQAVLAKIALEREQERMAAHEQAMKELADARKREEERQAAAREVQRLAKEKRLKAEQFAKDAEQARLREAAEEQRIAEQELNRKQEEIDKTIALQEALKRKMDEMERAEETAKKALRDAILQASTHIDTERIVPNPMARFFQPQE